MSDVIIYPSVRSSPTFRNFVRKRKPIKASTALTRSLKKGQYGLHLLSPGSRSLLLRFEKATRDVGGQSPESNVFAKHQSAKRALTRHLLRLEGSLPPDGRGRQRKLK